MASPHPLSADVTEAQADDEGGTLIARKVGEAVQNTLGAVVTAIDIPLGGPGLLLMGTMCVAEGRDSVLAHTPGWSWAARIRLKHLPVLASAKYHHGLVFIPGGRPLVPSLATKQLLGSRKAVNPTPSLSAVSQEAHFFCSRPHSLEF